jgi:hypothetical protein
MTEEILFIEEVDNYKPLSRHGKQYDQNEYAGYIVGTTKQQVELLISNVQFCCEQWGYFWCNDDPTSFIGAEILSIDVVNTELDKKKLPLDTFDEGDVMFVNFETDRGTLQFAAYNHHNGYYGHMALLISEQLELEKTL